MMRRIPAAIRLISLTVSSFIAIPALADIDLLGTPTLFSTNDVTLDNPAYLNGLSVTQHTLTGNNIRLQGNGSISLNGQLQSQQASVEYGSNLELNSGGQLATGYLSIMSGWNANSTISADGAGTRIHTNILDVIEFSDDAKSTLNLSNGAEAVIDERLWITTNSTANINQATLTTNEFSSSGTVNVSGSNSEFAITGYNWGYALGNINVSDGAKFTKHILDLRNTSFIHASGNNSSINAHNVYSYAENVQLDSGATLNADNVTIDSHDNAASITADGENTKILTNNLTVDSWGAENQASLNISDGASVVITNELSIFGENSIVNIDNGQLITSKYHNLGTINVSGANSSLEITDNNNEYANPLGRINFYNGAQFNKNDLNLRKDDFITASGTDTEINSVMTKIEGTTLALKDHATINNSAHIWITGSLWSGVNTSLDADNAEIYTGGISLNSWEGGPASLNLSNGATATIANVLDIFGADSVVNIDNSSLTTQYLHNEGTINVSGGNSSLEISNTDSFSQPLGRINFLNGAQFTKDHLQLWDGDQITASGEDTKINTFSTQIHATQLDIKEGASLNAIDIAITGEWNGDSGLVAEGNNTQVNTHTMFMWNNDPAKKTTLDIRNGASVNIENFMHIDGKNTVVTLNDGELNARTIFNQSKILSTGESRINGNITNNGIIDIEDDLTITGDLHMQDDGLLIFNFGNDPLNEFGKLTLNGNIWSEESINIRFDGMEYIDSPYGYSIDLIVASSFLPGIEMFNIDMSAFNFLGDYWSRSVSVIDNRLVLSIAPAVPVPASVWLMMSALISLGAIKKRKSLDH